MAPRVFALGAARSNRLFSQSQKSDSSMPSRSRGFFANEESSFSSRPMHKTVNLDFEV